MTRLQYCPACPGELIPSVHMGRAVPNKLQCTRCSYICDADDVFGERARQAVEAREPKCRRHGWNGTGDCPDCNSYHRQQRERRFTAALASTTAAALQLGGIDSFGNPHKVVPFTAAELAAAAYAIADELLSERELERPEPRDTEPPPTPRTIGRELCAQEGGYAFGGEHVQGKCVLDRGHTGRHSWEPHDDEQSERP